MRTSVCVISKNEEQYLEEWVEHYKELGFDNVLFYDNNEEGDDSQYNVLKNYIDEGFVIYHDYRMYHNCSQQTMCYIECLKIYKKEYDWIAFFDVDEFLTLEKHKNIKEFLTHNKEYEKYDSIAIRWIIMDDNDLVKNDGRPCKERFTRKNINFQPNMKSIANTKKIDIKKTEDNFNLHYLSFDNNICNVRGEKCNRFKDKKEENPIVYLKHFRFKTVEELIEKIKRGDAYFINFDRQNELIEWFFNCNKRTEEKEKLIKDFLL